MKAPPKEKKRKHKQKIQNFGPTNKPISPKMQSENWIFCITEKKAVASRHCYHEMRRKRKNQIE